MIWTIVILVVGSFTLLVSSSCQANAFHFIPHLLHHHYHHSTTFTSCTTSSSTTMSSNGGVVLNRVTPDQVALEIKDPVDPSALVQARAILDELVLTTTTTTTSTMVQEEALLKVAKRLGDLPPNATSCIVTPEECQAAYEGLTETERTALSNIYHRIKAFAEMQRRSVVDMEMDIPGGKAGHTVSPCRGESSWMIRFITIMDNVCVYVCVRERLGCGFGFGLDCHK
jgi:Histidinol dehydrogenase